jgi:hypothetical protein
MSEGLVRVALDVDGDRAVDRFFEISTEHARDLSEPLNDLMDQVLESVAAQFETEGAASDGLPWAPLSDDYSKWKAAHFPGFPILVATGEMKRAMLDREVAVHVGPDEAVYEPVSDIAGFHQHGAQWWGNAWNHPGPYLHVLPARPMVELSEEFKHVAVDRTFARWLAGVLQEARLESGAGVRLS